MTIYATIRDGSICIVTKEAAEAIVYNTAAWVPATVSSGRSMIRSWDVIALTSDENDSDTINDLIKSYTYDAGYPFKRDA